MKFSISSTCTLYIFVNFNIHLATFRKAHPPKHLAKCKYETSLLWSREVGHSAFAASPLIADIDADGDLDVIAAPFTDILTVVSALNGHTLPHSSWPHQLVGSSQHASPLLFDVNGDGLDDILLVNSNGELLFFYYNGTSHDASTKLPSVIAGDLWEDWDIGNKANPISNYISKSTPFDVDRDEFSYLYLDPHVFATPIIADVNGDGRLEELVMPVSYFHDAAIHIKESGSINESTIQYSQPLLASLLLFNLTNLQEISSVHLHFSPKQSEKPAYLLSSPTIIDLDSSSSRPEILLAVSGWLHAVSYEGYYYRGFPRDISASPGPVAVFDIDSDGILDLIYVNSSGVAIRSSIQGKEVWSRDLDSGLSTSGFRIADLDNDGKLEVMFAMDDGSVWVLNANDARTMDDWPYRVTSVAPAIPLITRLDNHPQLDVVIISDNHHMHIVRGDTKCRHAYKVGEMSYASVLAHDLVPHSAGLEMLVATRDGTLLCLGRPPPGDLLLTEDDTRYAAIEGMSSELKTYNGLLQGDGRTGIFLYRDTNLIDVTGSWLTVTFDILDELEKDLRIDKLYRVHVYLGSKLVSASRYSSEGTYSLSVIAPNVPSKAHMKLTVTNRHGQVYQDSAVVRFNMLFLHDLQWLLLCPYIALALSLLALHGYPDKDLLPMTRTKDT